MKLKTKTQNIFCCLNENLTTFLYTLTLCHPDKKTKCIQKLNVIKKKFGFWYLVLCIWFQQIYVMDRSQILNFTKIGHPYLLVRMISIFDFFLILTSTPKERQFPIIPIIPTIVVRQPPKKILNFSKFMLQPSFLQQHFLALVLVESCKPPTRLQF